MIDLWGYDIGRFVWFCAAGKLFFPGVGLLIFSAVIPLSKRAVWVNLIRYVFIVFGIIFVFLSATPLNWWIYIIWVVSFLAFLFVVSRPPRPAKTGLLPRKVFVFFCIMAFVFELPFHLSPKIPQKSSGKLYVIGDSVSAGIGGRSEQPWPEVLKDRYKVDVVNLSMAGATAGSIIPQTSQITEDNAIVLLEIGGNDLFDPTPPMIFEQNLRSLLQKVVKSNRVVIMLELPLAPWHIRYGGIQRKVAAEFGVILIPKSFFADVLSTKGATVDLAHLSPEGHKIMAEKVWSLLGKYLQAKPK